MNLLNIFVMLYANFLYGLISYISVSLKMSSCTQKLILWLKLCCSWRYHWFWACSATSDKHGCLPGSIQAAIRWSLPGHSGGGTKRSGTRRGLRCSAFHMGQDQNWPSWLWIAASTGYAPSLPVLACPNDQDGGPGLLHWEGLGFLR